MDGVFTYICLFLFKNVCKYTSPMDALGNKSMLYTSLLYYIIPSWKLEL